jgi:hypothetical protein
VAERLVRIATSDDPSTWPMLDELLTDAGDMTSWGENPGSVPAVHQVVVVFSWLEAGVYHQQAYGPIEVSDETFDGMPRAVSRAERRWLRDHDTAICQTINITVHIMEPL